MKRKLTKKNVSLLLKRFGNHSEVARQLGITASYYRRLRNQQEKVTPSSLLISSVRRILNDKIP